MKKEIIEKMAVTESLRISQCDEDWQRYKAIGLEICPDCGGALKKISGIIRYFFMASKKYKCMDCGEVHLWELLEL